MIFNILSAIVFFIILLCGSYLWVIALASIKPLPKIKETPDQNRFAIVIPAHNESDVIGSTVATLKNNNYPANLFDIYVVADFCTDQTAQIAREQGATCYERTQGERGGKGAALRFLFGRIFESNIQYDAIVVFDADTQVDSKFLQVMNTQLSEGALVIQGRHVISNPGDGWIPALSWALMTIDNRFNNHGRAILHLSAKHMGDSICFRSGVLERMGWSSGLTEDFELRLKLLLAGIRIQYEPRAIGYGQAPITYRDAQSQHLRWAKGVTEASHHYRLRLFQEGIRLKDWGRLDGAIGSTLPSYSTLTLISILIYVLNLIPHRGTWPLITALWGVAVIAWLIYPLLGLALEKAPSWAYLSLFTGPLYIGWRTWIYLRARLAAPGSIQWNRTPHKNTRANK